MAWHLVELDRVGESIGSREASGSTLDDGATSGLDGISNRRNDGSLSVGNHSGIMESLLHNGQLSGVTDDVAGRVESVVELRGEIVLGLLLNSLMHIFDHIDMVMEVMKVVVIVVQVVAPVVGIIVGTPVTVRSIAVVIEITVMQVVMVERVVIIAITDDVDATETVAAHVGVEVVERELLL